jgi:hypothetical protein
MALFMAFGVAFEVPVAIVLLCWVGVTTPDDLRKKRPYILVGAFVVGMLLTPPDVFSQTLLAIPMYCLFEVGVFFSRVSTWVKDVERMTKTIRPTRPLKSKTSRPSGRLLYGIRMFDIGLNLTSSQFAKDRDEVVARALPPG